MLKWGRSWFRRFCSEGGVKVFEILVRELAFFVEVWLGFVGVGFWVAGFGSFWDLVFLEGEKG